MAKNRMFVVTLVFCLVLTMTTVLAQVSDLTGHWAEQQVSAWVDKGLAGGYEDGTFRPDNNITRAEFVALLNRAFKVTQTGPIDFTDVKASDWYAGEVSAAKVAGYIGGYEDKTFRPDNPITREEVASILTRYLNLTPSTNLDSLKKFQDAPSDWSKAAVDAVATKALMGGYPDNTFKAQNPITRAEAVVTLDRAIALTVVVVPPIPAQQLVYDKAGTYGPETGSQTLTGDVTISVADVTLRNTIITGNLTLGEGIGDGNVYLNNVTVKGKTIVNGGGSHSVVINGCTLGPVESNKADVHIELVNGSSVVTITFYVGGSVTGDGVQTVTVAQTIPAGDGIVINGHVGELIVAGNAAVTVQGEVDTLNLNSTATVTVEGKVENLNVGSTATQATVAVAQGANVANLVANAAVTVTGEGQIQKATVNANGANIAIKPVEVVVSSGVTATVDGKQVTGTTTTPPVTGGGSTGGGGSVTPVAPTITGFSIVDVSGNNLYVKSQAPTISNATISVSKASNLDLTVNGTNLLSWTGLVAGSNDITLSTALKLDFSEALQVLLNSGLSEQDIINVVDFTSALQAIQNDPGIDLYGDVLPKVFASIDLFAGDKAAIYTALDLPTKYNAISDATVKANIEAAVQPALQVAANNGTTLTFTDLVGPNYAAKLAIINQALWRTQFYQAISFNNLFAAVRDYANRSQILDKNTVSNVFNAAATPANKMVLPSVVGSLYLNRPTMSQSTKNALYGALNLNELVRLANTKSIPINVVLTDASNANLKTTYSLMAR